MTTAAPSMLSSNWLKGPDLCDWLTARGVELIELEPHAQRRLRDWRKGGLANVYAVDRLLTRLGFHLSELPDELWAEDHSPTRSAQPPEVRRRAVERYFAGEAPTALGREFGVDRRTIVHWAQRERERMVAA